MDQRIKDHLYFWWLAVTYGLNLDSAKEQEERKHGV